MLYPVASDKTAELHPHLVYPGSAGSGFVTPGAPPISIFLETEFLVPGKVNSHHPELSYVNDATLGEDYGHSKVEEARTRALHEVSSRTKPLFFEALLRHVFEDDALDLRHMMVGVTPWDGYYYHDLGFIASKTIR